MKLTPLFLVAGIAFPAVANAQTFGLDMGKPVETVADTCTDPMVYIQRNCQTLEMESDTTVYTFIADTAVGAFLMASAFAKRQELLETPITQIPSDNFPKLVFGARG